MSPAYPKRDERRAAFRCILEAFSQATPITAALAHLYGYAHPSQFEQDLERFQRELATTVNDHSERLVQLEAILAPRTTLSPLALDVAFHVLRNDDTGRGDPVMFSNLQEAFSSVGKALLEEAVAELAHYEYATISATIGYPVRHFRPKTALFLAFDLAVTQRDTRADAVEIARLWLDEDAMHSVVQLNARLGWEPRRLNPPLRALRPMFPEGRWSRGIGLVTAKLCKMAIWDIS